MQRIAYYNEFDPLAAAWLRELIKAGHIAPGDVDERSIEDVSPDDLRGYAQCHFFAGIGVWSYALRRAGWPDDRPVWTGSCPCQPFSAAGKGGGFADERHLWPAFHWLIERCRPPVVLGEQVASKDGLAWLDLVQADLEGTGYAGGAVDLCAAGVGAPHIRQRLWWFGERVADVSRGRRREERADTGWRVARDSAERLAAGSVTERAIGRLDHHHHQGLEGQRSGHRAALGHGQGTLRPASEAGEPGGLADVRCEGRQGGERDPRANDAEPGRVEGAAAVAGHDRLSGEADAYGRDASAERQQRGREQRQQPEDGGVGGVAHADSEQSEQPSWQRAGSGEAPGGRAHGQPDGRSELAEGQPTAGPTNGFWRDADWLYCRDGRWRPVEPGTFPLAHGAAARVGRLRGYGNAIVAEAAVAFIEAYLEGETLDLAAEPANR